MIYVIFVSVVASYHSVFAQTQLAEDYKMHEREQKLFAVWNRRLMSHGTQAFSRSTRFIRASVDALYRDGASEISRPRTKRLKTRRE